MSFLERHRYFFDAPYGVLPGMRALPQGGKVRLVSFGIAGRLDAVIHIFSVDRIDVTATGGLAWSFVGRFRSVDELILHFMRSVPENSTAAAEHAA